MCMLRHVFLTNTPKFTITIQRQYLSNTCPNRQYIDLWMYVYVSRRSILQMYSNNILLDDRQVVLYIFIHIYMIWSVKYVYKTPY